PGGGGAQEGYPRPDCDLRRHRHQQAAITSPGDRPAASGERLLARPRPGEGRGRRRDPSLAGERAPQRLGLTRRRYPKFIREQAAAVVVDPDGFATIALSDE